MPSSSDHAAFAYASPAFAPLRLPKAKLAPSQLTVRPLLSPGMVLGSFELRSTDAPLGAITPPPTTESNLALRYRPTPLPSPKRGASDDKRTEPEEGADDVEDNDEPSPPPEPRPAHPHPDPDPRPATPATPLGKDAGGLDCASLADEVDDNGVPALIATRHSSMSTTASTSFSSVSRPPKADFIDDVSSLLQATAIGDAPAVFTDDDEPLVAAAGYDDEAEDPDRPWIYGRNEAERRYSNEMRRHTLGAMEKLIRAGRDGGAAPQMRKKRGSIRGRPDSSVIFET